MMRFMGVCLFLYPEEMPAILATAPATAISMVVPAAAGPSEVPLYCHVPAIVARVGAVVPLLLPLLFPLSYLPDTSSLPAAALVACSFFRLC
jgi:hypothetical protein